MGVTCEHDKTHAPLRSQKGGQKVDPLKIKSGACGGSSFGPFIVANLSVYFKLKLI